MTPDELAKAIRTCSDRLRVDDGVAETPAGELHGRGMLSVRRACHRVNVKFCVRRGFDRAARRDIARLLASPRSHRRCSRHLGAGLSFCRVADTLPFYCDDVYPGGRGETFSGISKITRELHRINLVVDSDAERRRDEELAAKLGLTPSDLEVAAISHSHLQRPFVIAS
jgi:hypothetical protein